MLIAESPTATAVRAPLLHRRRAPLRLLFFGFLSWLPVFATATAAQTWRASDFPLFQALVVITMAAATVLFASAYLREAGPATLRHGIASGLTWMATHLALGMLAFVGGPLEMPMTHFRTLAICTAIIPVITVGLAHQASRRILSP